jgi:hypothetical protein
MYIYFVFAPASTSTNSFFSGFFYSNTTVWVEGDGELQATGGYIISSLGNQII